MVRYRTLRGPAYAPYPLTGETISGIEDHGGFDAAAKRAIE
jgi:hypothetical protein